MQVVTQIGTSRDFQLKQAILIYEDHVSQREKFATVHQVTSQGPNRQASLGPGTLLTTSFLERRVDVSTCGRFLIQPGQKLKPG